MMCEFSILCSLVLRSTLAEFSPVKRLRIENKTRIFERGRGLAAPSFKNSGSAFLESAQVRGHQ